MVAPLHTNRLISISFPKYRLRVFVIVMSDPLPTLADLNNGRSLRGPDRHMKYRQSAQVKYERAHRLRSSGA
jgi:hypothetical protein